MWRKLRILTYQLLYAEFIGGNGSSRYFVLAIIVSLALPRYLSYQKFRKFKSDAEQAISALEGVVAAVEVETTFEEYRQRVTGAKAVVDRFLMTWPDDPQTVYRTSLENLERVKQISEIFRNSKFPDLIAMAERELAEAETEVRLARERIEQASREGFDYGFAQRIRPIRYPIATALYEFVQGLSTWASVNYAKDEEESLKGSYELGLVEQVEGRVLSLSEAQERARRRTADYETKLQDSWKKAIASVKEAREQLLSR